MPDRLEDNAQLAVCQPLILCLDVSRGEYFLTKPLCFRVIAVIPRFRGLLDGLALGQSGT
jgi:hypothetical protein